MTASYNPDRLMKQLRPVTIGRMYRVIRAEYATRPLGAIPSPSRFSNPASGYAVLYAAETVRCCFWEALVRNRLNRRRHRELPSHEVEGRLAVSLRSTEPLNLVDLRGDGPIRISAPTAVAHDSNHAAGRALSRATYQEVAKADGFLFNSCFTGHACVAVFDRAFSKLEALGAEPLIHHRDFLDALDDYDIRLISSD